VTTEERGIEQPLAGRRSDGPGTKVLVAIEEFSEPGRECLAGELLWPTAVCGRWNCTCGDLLHGITTHGNAAVGRVRLLTAPRAVLEAAITAAMQNHEGFEHPERTAAEFLDEVATFEERRLVRREEGILLPFPLAARITGPHSIGYRLSDEP
jgi:hypothetical protein